MSTLLAFLLVFSLGCWAGSRWAAAGQRIDAMISGGLPPDPQDHPADSRIAA